MCQKLSCTKLIWQQMLSITLKEICFPIADKKKREYLILGLQTPNEAFFHRNPELLGLDSQIRQINSGAFGVFWAELFVCLFYLPCP
jgi:hypothetical protein